MGQLDGASNLSVDLGVEIGFAAREQKRQKRIPRRVVAASDRLANKINEAFRRQIFGVAQVTNERPATLCGEVLRKDDIRSRLDLGRARVKLAISRLLKRSGHGAPFRQQTVPGAKATWADSSIAGAAPTRKRGSHFIFGRGRSYRLGSEYRRLLIL